MPSPVLGIDLGTTNSVVACADEQRVRVLRDEDGQLITPSAVSFDESGRMLVGREARKRRSLDASNTIFSVKRLIGRPFRSAEVRRAAERLPFALEEGGNGGVSVRVRGESYTLPEISSFILRHVRAVAEGALGQPCSKAVVTVPANFNELQRTATRDAGRIAGLTVLRILNEPTAAALAYGYRARQGQRIAVYDLGGGTFDISILELSGDVIEVVATAGDTNLGGDDFDGLVADRMVGEFQRQHELDLGQDPQQYERVRMAAEWIKCQLSHQESAEAVVKDVARASGQRALDLRFRLSRAELQQLAAPLIARTFASCEEAMRLAHIRPTQLDGVILVGGQTRTPAVRQMVAEYFGLQPQTSVDPELVVAQGAALQGYALSGVPAAGTVVNATLQGVAPATESEEEAASDDVMPKVVGQDAFDDEPTRVALDDEIPPKKRSQIEFEDLPTTIAFRDDPDDALTKISEYMTAQEVDEVLATARELPAKPPQNRADTRRGVGPTAAVGGGVQPHAAAVRAQPAVARTHPPRPPGAKPNASSPAPPPAAPPPESAAQSLPREAAGPRSARPAPEAATPPPAAAHKPLGARSVPPPRPTIPLRPVSLRSGALAGSAPRSLPVAPASQARTEVHAPATAADVPASESSAQPRAGGPSSTTSLARSTLAHADGVQHRASTRPVRAAASKEPGPRPASAAGAAVRAPGERPSAAPPRGHSWRPSSAPQPIEVRGLGTPANDGKDMGISDPSIVFSESTLLRSQFPGPPSMAPLLLDVTPHTLSVETAGGFCEPIIERNAPIPTEQTRVFSTSQDDQVTVSVRVCQGESKHTDENQALGQIELLGLRRGRRGEVSIAVTFIIDADGTLNVKAIDRTTGQGQALRVDLVGAIGEGDLERMRERQRTASR